MSGDVWTYVLGPFGLLVGVLIAMLAGSKEIWYWGHEVRSRLAEKDKQIADMTLDRDRWQERYFEKDQLFQRLVTANTTISEVAVRGRKAAP